MRGRRACWLPRSYTVVVAEKPRAADKIARALGKAYKCQYWGVPFWVVRTGDGYIVVAPSAGHLYGPYTAKRSYPVFEMEWRPLWVVNKRESHLRKFHGMLERVMANANAYVNA